LVLDNKWHGSTISGLDQHALSALSESRWWFNTWHW
jgi:hypothetical protein